MFLTLSSSLVWNLWWSDLPQRSMKSGWWQTIHSTWRLPSSKCCQGSSCAPTLQVMTQKWWLGKISEASVGTRRYVCYVCHALCVCWRYFIFQKLIWLKPLGRVGTLNAMSNQKISASSLPFCGNHWSSWKHFWPHLRVGSEVREPRSWPSKLDASKISVTADLLLKT